MKFRFVLLTLGAALCAPVSALVAQTDDAAAGWLGLMSTPAGALPPVVVLRPTTGGPLGTLVQLRYGHWSFEGTDQATNSLGAGVSFSQGASRTTLELGVSTRSQCENCRAVIGGVDVNIPLTVAVTTRREDTDRIFSVALNPAVGFMKPTGEGTSGYALSLSGSVPFSVSFKVGEYTSLAPFLAPGAGFGLINGGHGADSQSGFRWMLGGGVALVGITPGVQITGSFRKVFIEGGRTTFGLGLTIGR